MKHHLLAPAQQRRGRVALTLVASLVFHGSLVGVAALWPYHTAIQPEPLPPITGDAGPPIPLPPIDQTPDPSTPGPVKYELPTPSDPVPPPVDDETPPPTLDNEMQDPQPATPPPHPATAARPRTSRVPDRSGPRGPVTSVAHTGTPGTPGAVSGVARPGTAHWNVSAKPAYPMSLKAAGIQGSGTVHVTTDGSGRVVEATMSQSTGSSALDLNTCRHARAFWTGPANASTDVPITYRLN